MARVRDLSLVFESLLTPERRPGGFPSRWCPAADVYRTRSGWLVKLELAGVSCDDVDVSVQGRTLTVRGRRRDTQLTEGGQQMSLEISYSEFERRIELPCELERARIDLDSKDGMLLVRIAAECKDE